jgi:hypothetical protein
MWWEESLKKKMLRAILALKTKQKKKERKEGKNIYIRNDGAHFYADSLKQLRPSLGTSISHFPNERSFKKKKDRK